MTRGPSTRAPIVRNWPRPASRWGSSAGMAGEYNASGPGGRARKDEHEAAVAGAKARGLVPQSRRVVRGPPRLRAPHRVAADVLGHDQVDGDEAAVHERVQ